MQVQGKLFSERATRQVPSSYANNLHRYYYDMSDHRYSCKDFWLRKTDQQFKLKHPTASGHEGGISSYVESEDPVTILNLLGLATAPNHKPDLL